MAYFGLAIMVLGAACPCACGWQPSHDGPPKARAFAGRVHYFWDCIVAAAVVGKRAKPLPFGARVNSRDLGFCGHGGLACHGSWQAGQWACLHEDTRLPTRPATLSVALTCWTGTNKLIVWMEPTAMESVPLEVQCMGVRWMHAIHTYRCADVHACSRRSVA